MPTAHLEKRYKSTWTIVIELGRDADGRRRRMLRSVKGSKREAEAEMRRLLAEIETGTYREPSSESLASFLRRWLAAHGSALAPSTRYGYGKVIEKHIIPSIGHIPLGQLRPAHIQQYCAAALEGGASSTTALQHFRILHKALGQAVKWGEIPVNPCDGATPPKRAKPEIRALSPEELRRLVECIPGDRERAIVLLAVATGMRRGEIIALRWRDVDLQGLAINVRRTAQRVGGEWVVGEPKTKAGRRTVALPPEAAVMLRRWRELQEASDPDGLVFPSRSGGLLDPSDLDHRFQAAAREAGFPGFRFHDLRHTHASLLLARGVHPKVVQERLGHSSITVTMDTYSHVLRGLQEDAARRLSDLLGQTGWHRLGTGLPPGTGDCDEPIRQNR